MDIPSFYLQVKPLLPYTEDSDLNFKQKMANAFKAYLKIANTYLDKDEAEKIKDICIKLLVIVDNSLKGLQAKAYVQLQNLIQGNEKTPPKIELNLIQIPPNYSFYRIRQMELVYKVKPEDLFHIPLNQRGIVKTQRYSTPGYPCLYLGNSIYGCWEEMHRPPMYQCATSRFVSQNNLNLIDLSIPTKKQLYEPKCRLILPLIIACMIPVAHDNHTYKPEYIIPQLLIEWVLKIRKTFKDLHGIAYTSTHYNKDFNFPDDKFINYAIPVFNVDVKNKYCPTLCSIFKVSDPTTNDLEKLKEGYNINLGEYDESSDEYRFNSSDFGNLESRLKDETRLRLHDISCL